LEKLRRYDEALEAMEDLLRDFGQSMPAEAREKAQRKVVELRALVGVIEIEGAEIGAAILVDGRSRGEYPLLGALRVAAGSHLVRVAKAGFEPFEARVDVAGGRSARVEARLRALTRSGRLRVAEQRGRSAVVLVDGGAVGATPWEGQLPVGEHVIVLRGEGELGTPPISVVVELDRTTPLTLEVEELAAQLRVEPSPVNASVAIDSITVGRGIWEGRLRVGAHRAEVTAPGFLPTVTSVTVARGGRKTLAVMLERDPRSPFAQKPSRLFVQATQSALLAPSLGGDIGEALGAGGHVGVDAGYELPFRLAFGLSVGALRLQGTTRGRSAVVRPVDLRQEPSLGPLSVDVDDTIDLRALRVGAFVGFSLGERALISFRLGAGALLGSISDHRSSAPESRDTSPALIGSTSEARAVRGLYLLPEVRAGFAVNAHFTLQACLGLLTVVSFSPAVWDERGEHPAVIRDGSGRVAFGIFTPDTYGDRVLLSISPGIGVRHDF
jgi:hypothetical protein